MSGVSDMMPTLYNYVTVDSEVFLSQPSHMEMVFNICRTVSITRALACFSDNAVLASSCCWDVAGSLAQERWKI